MLTYYLRTLKDTEIKEVDEPRAGVWIHANNLRESEIEVLVDRHGLDRGVLEDANDFFEVPRFEQSGGIGYFFTRYPATDQDTGETFTTPILIAIGEDFVLTITIGGKPKFFEQFFSKKVQIHTTQKAKFFIQIMEEITKQYTRSFITMRRSVRQSRVHIEEIDDHEIELFVRFENSVNDFISALVPTNTALTRVLSGKYLQLYEEDADLMEDLRLANIQLVESGNAVLKTIQNVRDAYSTIMTNRLNKVVRTLTALTILLTIPTIIASLYGMNVAVPFGDHPQAFWLVVAMVMMVSGFAGYLFARNRWI